MSQPPYPYNRIFDFESFSINTPAAQQPGVQLEGEYDAIKRTIDGLISRLAEIQRDDGKLRGEAFDITTASTVYLAILALLQPTLALKANLASPALTGTPTAPTPATNSNNTNIATTAFVKAQGYTTTTSLNNAINGVESLIDAVDARVDATNEEVSHKLDKRTGGVVLEDVTLYKKLHVYGYSPEIIVQSTNSADGICNLTNSFIQFLNGYGNGYSIINNGLLAVSQSTVGFAQLEPNKISVSNQFAANKVELSSAGLKFLDGTLQSSAFIPANYATNESVDTKIATRLPLAGGTMTGDIVFPADGNNNDSQIGPWGLGVENTNGKVAYIQSDIFRIYDNDHLTGTSVNGEGIKFNDSTIQTTAATDWKAGGISNDSASFQFQASGSNYYSEIKYTGITFNNGDFANAHTIQDSGGIYVGNGANGTNNIQIKINGWFDYAVAGMKISENGITYPDNSVQTTASIPVFTNQIVTNSSVADIKTYPHEIVLAETDSGTVYSSSNKLRDFIHRGGGYSGVKNYTLNGFGINRFESVGCPNVGTISLTNMPNLQSVKIAGTGTIENINFDGTQNVKYLNLSNLTFLTTNMSDMLSNFVMSNSDNTLFLTNLNLAGAIPSSWYNVNTTVLGIDSVAVDDFSFINPTTLPYLRWLRIGNNVPASLPNINFASFTHLETLYIRSRGVDGINTFSLPASLKAVDLSGSNFWDFEASMSNYASLTNLISINFSNCNLYDAEFIPVNAGVEYINLDDNDFSGDYGAGRLSIIAILDAVDALNENGWANSNKQKNLTFTGSNMPVFTSTPTSVTNLRSRGYNVNINGA